MVFRPFSRLKGKKETPLVSSSFIMEVPKLCIPNLYFVLKHVTYKLKDFIIRTFTIIYISSMIIWCLQHFDLTFHLTNNPDLSILAILSKSISFLFVPLGFSDWRLITSLITGFSAKEVILSTITILIPAQEIYTIPWYCDS